MSRESNYLSELEHIASQNGGILRAADVVAYARDPKTILHGKFLWDDGEAARLYRDNQARQLIRVAVKMIGNGSTQAIRAFVSLSTDRDEGGYRSTIEVLSDAAMKARLLQDALAELDSFRVKYQELVELAGVFQAADEIRQDNKTKSRRRKAA